MNLHRITAWLLSAVLLVAPAFGQERSGRGGEIDLRPRFEVGQTLRYKLELRNSSINELAQGQPPGRAPAPQGPSGTTPGQLPADKTESAIELGMSMKVREVSPEGVATIDLVIDALKLSTKMADIEMEFDSSAPAKDQDELTASLLRPIVGTTMALKIDRAGNISSITGGEALAMFGQVGAGGAGGGVGGAAGLFGPITASRPSRGFAKIGESWEYDDAIGTSLMGNFKMTTRHTLKGMRGREALVGITGKIEPESEGQDPGGMQIKNSSYSGSYAWDTGKGQLSTLETSMSVRLEGKVADQPMATRNESVVKVTRLPDRP